MFARAMRSACATIRLRWTSFCTDYRKWDNPWRYQPGRISSIRDVIVVIGPGQIGQGIARRVGVGKHVVLADMRPDNANAAADVLASAGYDVSVATVDSSSRSAVRALVDTVARSCTPGFLTI